MRDLIDRQETEALLRTRAEETRAKAAENPNDAARETLISIALGYELAANTLWTVKTAKEQANA